MFRTSGLGAALLCLSLGLASCISPTDPLGREEALEDAQKKYTELIRWGDVERAVTYVEEDQRDEFLELADSMEDLHITDFDIGEIDFTKDKATVTVTYHGYSEAVYVEHSAREVQEWERKEGIENHWFVRSELADVVAELQGKTVPSRRN